METTVQIFKDDDIMGTVMDTSETERWHTLVKLTGLRGQNAVVEADKSPVPFVLLNDRFTKVLETLCPRAVPVAEYDKSPIPLKVLETIKFVLDAGFFTKLEVWYDDKSPDPFLVGKINRNRVKNWFYAPTYTIPDKAIQGKYLDGLTTAECNTVHADAIESVEVGKYLVARWGDEARTLIELTEMAKDRFRKMEIARLKQEVARAERALLDVDYNISELFPV